MAPEIANRKEITPKADVWSLAVIMAEIVCGPIRPSPRDIHQDFSWAKEGRYNIKNMRMLTKALQSFFRACLKVNYKERPDIFGVKNLRFYKQVKWDDVVSLKLKPPINPADLKSESFQNEYNLDPYDSLLLSAAYGRSMPSINKCLQTTVDNNNTRCLVSVPPNNALLEEFGLTHEKIDKLFASFYFSNPIFRFGSKLDRLQENDTNVLRSPSEDDALPNAN